MRALLLCLVCFQVARGSRELLGGWEDVDTADNGGGSFFSEVVDFAVDRLANSQNTLSRIVLIKSYNAKQQLVNGINYRFDLDLGHTNCFRNQPNDNNADCNVEREQTCNVKVHRSFSGENTMTWFQCGQLNQVAHRNKRSLFGGLRPAAPEEVNEAVEFATKSLNSDSNGFYVLSVHRVKNVQKQVVAGMKYYIKLDLLVKSCNDKKLLSSCAHNDLTQEVIGCQMEVVDQAWSTPRFELLKHGCESSSTRTGKLVFSDHPVEEDLFEAEDALSVTNLKRMSSYQAFQAFKVEFQKKYPNEGEESKRMKIFVENLDKADFYQRHDLGTAVYGATPLSDLTEEEFRQKYLTKEWDLNSMRGMPKAQIPKMKDLPKEFDWRNLSAVSSVKNQGSCGSCWAFCVVGNIEGVWAIKHKQLLDLSAQELVDCDQIDMGCNGGLPAYAYLEIQRLGGLQEEQEYPYHGKEEVCSFTKDKIKVYINGSVNISTNENEMAAWMVENGPMAIGIDALAMQFYRGGISHPWSIFCPKALNHGVVIVGYGVKKGWFSDIPYWIVKNSWGSKWGENGYYLVYRGSGVCGLNLMVSSATID